MSSLSSLQTLPQHIVKRIIHYVTRSSRLLFSGTAIDLRECPELLIQLLSVCRSFRTVVYSQYSTQYDIYLGHDVACVPGIWSSWPPGLREVGSPAFSLVQELAIIVDIHSIYSGSALDALSCSTLNSCLFPAASLLTCAFSWASPEAVANSLETETNICAFVKRIKEMAPAVDTIVVHAPSNRKIGLSMSGHHFGSLISRLFELAGRVSYYSTARCLSMDLQPDDIRNLVHLDYQIKGGNTAQIMQVVRQSSSTLQHLALGAKKDMYVSRLIYGADGSYLRYPCLAVLALNLPTSLPRLCQPVTDGVVLFPSIRRLSILDGYPFGDDTLFRGNAASLETLHIMPSRDMCDVLCMFNVFTPASHPNLQCVKIEQLHNDSPSHFESSREYLQFVLGIAPKTAVRDIAGVADKAWLHPALDLLQHHPCLQALALPNASLLFGDVASLVNSLPLLSDLYCLETGLGTFTEAAALDMASSCKSSLCRPTTERFRCWHLGFRDDNNLKEIVICVLGVALMCPNFSHVALSNCVHDGFMSVLEETIESDKFRQYNARLRRLLFQKV